MVSPQERPVVVLSGYKYRKDIMKHLLITWLFGYSFLIYAQDLYLSTTGNYHSSSYSAFIDSQNSVYDLYRLYDSSSSSFSPSAYTTPNIIAKPPPALLQDVISKYAGQRIPHNTSSSATLFTPFSITPIVPVMLAAQYATSPEEQQSYTELAYDVLNTYDALLAETGTPKYDLATALTFFLQHNVRVISGDEPTPGQYQAVLEVMRTLILESSAYQTATDEQKQEAYEAFIIMGLGVASLYDKAVQNGDTVLIEQLRERAYLSLIYVIGPLDRWQLTENDLFLVY